MSVATGGLILPSMYTILGVVCVSSIVGIGNAAHLLVSFLQNLIFPFLLNENSGNMDFVIACIVIISVAIVSLVLIICLIPETAGMTKNEIYVFLRNQKSKKNDV